MEFDYNLSNQKCDRSYKHLGLVCYSKELDRDLYDDIENQSRLNSKIDLNENDILNEILDEDEVRESLEVFVKSHCFYRKKPLKMLNLNDLKSFNCYRYVLQTFTETRKTSFTCEPFNPYYTNDHKLYNFDSNSPWSVRVKPKKLFSNEKIKLEIPGTSQIENCETCSGNGSRTCEKCNGDGKKTCSMCKGSGYSDFGIDCNTYDNLKNNYNDNYNTNGFDNYRTQYQVQTFRNQCYNYRNVYNINNFTYPMDHIYCIQCNGRGTMTCNECDGGEVNCSGCNATGKLRWFVELEVSFETFEDDYIENPANLPEDLLFDCTQKQIYYEQKEKLKSIKDNPYYQLNKTSKYLINTHLSKYSFSKIIAQRQFVYLIPITGGCFRNKYESFYIYGTEHKVYFPNYPGKVKCNII